MIFQGRRCIRLILRTSSQIVVGDRQEVLLSVGLIVMLNVLLRSLLLLRSVWLVNLDRLLELILFVFGEDTFFLFFLPFFFLFELLLISVVSC
jgi:hypothetical protein